MIDVFIVNRSGFMCSLVAAALRSEPGIRVSGSAIDVDEALNALRSQPCDIVLVSTNLPDFGALRLVEELKTVCSAKALVFGVAEMEEIVLRYIEAGASGCVFGEDSVDDLLTNIRAIHNGEAHISPELAASLIARLAELAALRPSASLKSNSSQELTPREEEVLDLIGRGLSNQEIANYLVIEVGTVKNHVHSILQKLDVNSRQDAAKYWNGGASAKAAQMTNPKGCRVYIKFQYQIPNTQVEQGFDICQLSFDREDNRGRRGGHKSAAH
jgi:DNA-binding NarL/FixJ family response regulator